jgi:hypothetical protein
MRAFLATVALGVLLVGCDSNQTTLPSPAAIKRMQSDYDAALSDATNSIPFAVEFARLFPVTQSGFSYYIGGAGPSSLYMEAFLFERYQMRMRVPVTFDKERRKVKSVGEPEFQIREVEKVEKNPDGGLYVKFTDRTRTFGAGDWQRLVNAGGDFSAIGYMWNTTSSAPGFDYWRKDEEMGGRRQP